MVSISLFLHSCKEVTCLLFQNLLGSYITTVRAVNGCDIEVLAALTPLYDVERFGIINTGNPKHADIFLVTGGVNERNIDVVKEIYDQMVEPKVVVACGVCACTAGIFKDCYNIIGGVDQAIPVDVYAPGCAIRPEAIIDAVSKESASLRKVEEAQRREEERGVSVMELNETFVPLALEDLVDTAREYKEQGYQLAQMMGVLKEDDTVWLYYTFIKGNEVINRRIEGSSKVRPKCLRSRRSISLSS